MAYRFIEQYQKDFELRWLLNRMGIFPNAYYNYVKQTKAVYHERKKAACQKITEIYHEVGGILGHRSMRIFLARKSSEISKKETREFNFTFGSGKPIYITSVYSLLPRTRYNS